MQLSNQDPSQIDEDELLNLPEEKLRYLLLMPRMKPSMSNGRMLIIQAF